MKSPNCWLAPLLLILWLAHAAVPAAAQTSQPKPTYGEPQAVCQIADPRLDEASGLVASRPGFYCRQLVAIGVCQVNIAGQHRIC